MRILLAATIGTLLLAGCATHPGTASASAGGAPSEGATCATPRPTEPSAVTMHALAALRDGAASTLPKELAEQYRNALARERANDFVAARQLYMDLGAKLDSESFEGSESDFSPYIDFALGEMFFKESLAFGSYKVNALTNYSAVLQRGADDTPLYAFALLRVAELSERAGESEAARAAYQQLLSELPKSPAVADVPRWAR